MILSYPSSFIRKSSRFPPTSSISRIHLGVGPLPLHVFPSGLLVRFGVFAQAYKRTHFHLIESGIGLTGKNMNLIRMRRVKNIHVLIAMLMYHSSLNIIYRLSVYRFLQSKLGGNSKGLIYTFNIISKYDLFTKKQNNN